LTSIIKNFSSLPATTHSSHHKCACSLLNHTLFSLTLSLSFWHEKECAHYKILIIKKKHPLTISLMCVGECKEEICERERKDTIMCNDECLSPLNKSWRWFSVHTYIYRNHIMSSMLVFNLHFSFSLSLSYIHTHTHSFHLFFTRVICSTTIIGSHGASLL
jgi:hypothetical protein